MNSTTLKLFVTGSSHLEIVSKAEEELSKFFDTTDSEKIKYEIFIEKSIDEEKSSQYTAQIIAKVKNGY
jgi:predicted ATP-grasp superfamily ATP-dependent carboligase